MNTVFRCLKAAFPFVGERAATEGDLFEFCERGGIEVVFAHEIRKGLYVRRCGPVNSEQRTVNSVGKDYIFLNSMLHGWSLLYVFAHEIGHVLLHSPTRSRGSEGARERGSDAGGPALSHSHTLALGFQRTHREAEQAAALLLLPIRDLNNLPWEHVPASGDAHELVVTRLEYYGVHQV